MSVVKDIDHITYAKKLTVLDGDLGASVGSLLGLNEGDELVGL